MRQAIFALTLFTLAGCTRGKTQAPKPAASKSAENGPVGVFGRNTIDDVFSVKALEAGGATLEGAPKDLKVGDTLYFNRSPFHFAVTAVQGTKVTISLGGASTDLAVGNTLFRYENDTVKNAIDSEKRLKDAVGE